MLYICCTLHRGSTFNITVQLPIVLLDLKASILALAGKFDGILLPAITTTHSYRAISEEHAVVDDATHFSRPCFAEQGRIGNILMDETESEANSAKLMKTENYKQHRACITAFASGTGLAGIVGYGYKALISDLLGWSLSACVWSAVVFPLAYYFIYRNGVHNIELSMLQIITPSDVGHSRSLFDGLSRDRNISNGNQVNTVLEMVESELMYPEQRQQVQTNCSVTPHNLTSYERFKLVLSLWKYTIPLFTVYSAEYMLQAGVWPSIGFPVTSAIARAQFYQYSNWTVSECLCLYLFFSCNITSTVLHRSTKLACLFLGLQEIYASHQFRFSG